MDERTAQRAQDTYRENQIQMATREQLLLITYDIGIRYCLAAEKAIQSRDVEQINMNLQKAQARAYENVCGAAQTILPAKTGRAAGP